MHKKDESICQDWEVGAVAACPDPQSTRWIFKVNYEAANSIKAANYHALTGVDRVMFKIPDDPRTKDMAKDTEGRDADGDFQFSCKHFTSQSSLFAQYTASR